MRNCHSAKKERRTQYTKLGAQETSAPYTPVAKRIERIEKMDRSQETLTGKKRKREGGCGGV